MATAQQVLGEGEGDIVRVVDVEQKVRKKKSHNVFTAFKVTNPEILENIRLVQASAVKSDPTLQELLFPLARAHITLHAFYADLDNLGPLEGALEQAAKAWRDSGKELRLHFRGVTTFKDEGQIVITRALSNPDLDKFYAIVTDAISRLNLDGVALHPSFEPHLTLMKIRRPRRGTQPIRARIEEMHYVTHKDTDFGTHDCRSLQLLAMAKLDGDTGYYQVLKEVPLT